MPDYKIKFEYEGLGKKASAGRQNALQAQKKSMGLPEISKPLSKKGISTQQGFGKETVSSIKVLNKSIKKLISSNESLAKNIKGSSALGRGGSGGGLGAGGAGIGRIGASIPILGAAIAAIGFSVQKINQIGNAYIEKASQQLGNVGIGGFRRGEGVYNAAQMGAGMKAYGMGAGQFATGATPNKTALQMGGVFGLSAEETLRTAGQFKRAGANYQQAAYTGAGAGIQTELPMLLTGMADILTEAIRDGVNTSDMSKDLAKEVSALTMRTPGKSVEAALNIVRSFQGVQKGLAGGKMGTAQGLFAAKASQQMLMERITGKGGKEYIKSLEDQGFISAKQAKAMGGLEKGTGFEKFLETSPSAAYSLLRKFTAEASPAMLQKRTIGIMKSKFGDTPEGRQRAYDFALSQGFSENQAQLETLMQPGQDIGKKTTEAGRRVLAGKSKQVERSEAGMTVQRQRVRENLIFKYGNEFAKSSLKMEKAMISLAEGVMPVASAAISKLGEVTAEASKSISTSIENFGKLNKKMSNMKISSDPFSNLYELAK